MIVFLKKIYYPPLTGYLVWNVLRIFSPPPTQRDAKRPVGGGETYGISDYGIPYVNGWGEEEYMKWIMSTANYLMMIPFSIEKLSVGRPAMFQSLIFTGSPKVPVTEKSFEQGMLVSRQAFTHSTVCCWQEKTREIILWSRAQRTGRWWYWRRRTPALIKILLPLNKAFWVVDATTGKMGNRGGTSIILGADRNT